MTSSVGASTPIAEYVGSSATRNVESPIINMHRTRTFLRPCRSPQWPRTNAPSGRATYPTPNVASEATTATVGSVLAKKTDGNTSVAACA